MAIRAGEMLLSHYQKQEVPIFFNEKLLDSFPDEESAASLKEERCGQWNEERSALIRQWLKKLSSKSFSQKKWATFSLEPDCVDHAVKILNDLRLALAVKYNVQEDEMNRMPETIADAKRREAIMMIHWCGGLQHYLIENLQEL